jgi:hypothetical protein
MADFDFDVSAYEAKEYSLIEAGQYDAIIVGSEKKQNKNGGQRLELKLQIISENAKNRTLYDILNLWNKSQEATDIARGTLKSISDALSVPKPKGSEELHNKRLRIVVGIEKREDNGELKNVVKGYKPAEKQVATVNAGGDARPW